VRPRVGLPPKGRSLHNRQRLARKVLYPYCAGQEHCGATVNSGSISCKPGQRCGISNDDLRCCGGPAATAARCGRHGGIAPANRCRLDDATLDRGTNMSLTAITTSTSTALPGVNFHPRGHRKGAHVDTGSSTSSCNRSSRPSAPSRPSRRPAASAQRARRARPARLLRRPERRRVSQRPPNSRNCKPSCIRYSKR
jgi:hypothetical protein